MTSDPLDKTGVLPASEFSPNAPGSHRLPPVFPVQDSAEQAETTREQPQSSDRIPYLGPRYEVLRKLGQGGMGAVYLALDHESNTRVAIKTLPTDIVSDEYSMQRFQKEIRLLSEVNHTNVANLIDVGRHDRNCFLVMELVEGTDLKHVVESYGALPERVALQIIREVCAGLEVAHRKGIVHRDLKPANILLSAIGVEGESPEDAVFAAVQSQIAPAIKLTDFGLARHIDQGASLQLTQTSAMLGTPYYIAPEQCTDSGKLTPGTDIYSLGITLFELLTGSTPFVADDPVKLITMHCFDDPPQLAKINSEISERTAQLVHKAIQKSPDDRFVDATHLKEEIDQILSGGASSSNVHPILPKTKGSLFEAEWQWELDGSHEDLWPLVSNTERVNASVGLPPVEYETRRDEQGQKHRFGSFKLGWTRLSWEEHPFEWVEGRRLSILREFENGPFRWFVSQVELTPKPQGGCRLSHRVKIAPRGLLGWVLAYVEVTVKGRKPLDKVYRRINEMVMGRLQGGAATDAYSPPGKISTTSQKRLNAIREKLIEDKVDTDCLQALLDYIIQAPPQKLARIRPRKLAQRLDVPESTFAATCLAACSAGLLELHWDILCPTCRVAASVKDTLKEIDRHEHCESCEHDFDVDLAKSVELIFRVHPEIRQADLKTYCIGGPEHAPHVVAQVRMEANESLELDCHLSPGAYVIRGAQLPYTINLVADPATGTHRTMLMLDPSQHTQRPIRVLAGRQVLLLTNQHEENLVVRLERSASQRDAITAADAQNLPRFQELFPGETISRDRLSNVSTCTLLAFAVTNILDLFETLGDLQTCERMRQTFERFQSVVQAHEGEVIKESDDRMVAKFPTAQSAMHAAGELYESFQSEDYSHNPLTQIAVHRGIAMSTSFNGKVSYVGKSVTQLSRLLESAPDRPWIVSGDIAQDESCQDVLETSGRILRKTDAADGSLIYEIETGNP
ncbi:protein kinase domain-containing protein [Bremerella sp. P1]|uniref:protein kinase domain-containing protein n=1 Tax=Bremerella sp. P1 TaxID=3026424 RepID=UPI002368E353|nr:protein kinase [Bremerella sp. P1]WDI43008.1 protein kinase [Bremerella sp. P1]